MPSRAASDIDAETKISLYVQDLHDLPLSAVEQACKDFRRGNCGDGHWAPTAAEIRAQAIKYLPRPAPLNRLGYEGKPRDPKERERVKAGFAKLLAELRGNVPRPRKEFDPAAVSFSPYELGMTQAQITELVMMYRNGEDWREKYQLFLGGNNESVSSAVEFEITDL